MLSIEAQVDGRNFRNMKMKYMAQKDCIMSSNRKQAHSASNEWLRHCGLLVTIISLKTADPLTLKCVGYKQ